MDKYILLLGANQFQRERALIGAEKAFSGPVATVANSATYNANKYSAFTLNSIETNGEQLLKDVIDFSKKMNRVPAAVIPLNDFVLNAGHKIAEYYDLTYNSKEVINNCRTKDILKSKLAPANVPVVESIRFSSIEDAKKLSKKIKFPLVIKPLNFGGSGGVIKVENDKQLESAILTSKKHLEKYAKHYDSESEELIIEPYINIKREVSVEVINTTNFRKVIGITEKFLGKEPYFSEIGHLVPSDVLNDDTLSKNISTTAIKACQILGIEYGMAHVEMKIGASGEIILIEVGCRTAGDGIMDLYEKATHKNIYELHCKAFLNTLTEADLPQTFFTKSAIGYLHPNPGVIEKINLNKDIITASKYIDLITVRATEGQKVESAKDWSTRYGFVEFRLDSSLHTNEFSLIDETNKICNQIFTIGAEN